VLTAFKAILRDQTTLKAIMNDFSLWSSDDPSGVKQQVAYNMSPGIEFPVNHLTAQLPGPLTVLLPDKTKVVLVEVVCWNIVSH
jgi:hypothetical protein